MRLLLLLCLLLAAPDVRAQGFDLPGLSNDAAAYQRRLERRFPAGATPQQREAAAQRAMQAERAGNWAAAAQAWEERVAIRGRSTGSPWPAPSCGRMRPMPATPCRPPG